MTPKDHETGAEWQDPILEEVNFYLDKEIVKRIDEIKDKLNIERDKVVALAIYSLLTQVQLQDDGIVLMAVPAEGLKTFSHPLEMILELGPPEFQHVFAASPEGQTESDGL